MKLRFPGSANRYVLLLIAGLALVALSWGCSKKSTTMAPDLGPSDVATANLISPNRPDVVKAMRMQEQITPALMRTTGVVGTAVGADDAGNVVVKVFTESALPENALPAQVGGFRVEQEVTGKFIAYKGSGGGTSHTAKQTPPIQLGTSGGSVTDLANGYCCSGTLGSLVTKNGVQYILSNSHVFAGDVVSGGNGKVAAIGDDVTQPGYVDNNCSTSNTNHVADVSSLSTLYPPASTPNVDCAIAQVVAGMVNTTGAILEVGTISHNTVGASVGQAVKKSGRTTGLTRSTISGLNATISVGYETECGGGSFTKTFTGQIIVSNRRSAFLNSGDSGSLMVEDVTTNPRAVGLLYAGSSTTAVANPIGSVLSFLGVTMVGN
jgi:hypothetical protein